MKLTIVIAAIVLASIFFWCFSMGTEMVSTEIEQKNPLKPIIEKWSANSLTISLLLIAAIIIGAISKSIKITGISMAIVVVGAWMFWV